MSDRIERANRGYLKAYEANARMMAVLEQVATFNPRLAAVRRASRRFWVQRGAESIRRWQEHGMVDERIDPAYAASALGSMVDRSAYVWIVLGEPYDRDEAVIQLTRLYCNALGIPYHRDAPGAARTAEAPAGKRSRALSTNLITSSTQDTTGGPMLLSDIVRLNGRKTPSRTAIITGERTVTFGELRDSAWRVANAMLELAEPGDRVGILAENIPEYVECYYGVPAAGMALTFLNYRLHPKEWAWILNNAEASVLIVAGRSTSSRSSHCSVRSPRCST